MLSVEVDLSGILAGLDQLTADAEAAARPAAQAGAQVFYNEVKARAPRSVKAHSTRGKKQTYQPGNLKAAVYQAFSEKQSGNGRATYRISWNKSKAFYGRFVEFGTSKAAARPFLRPAYEAMKAAAADAVRQELIERIKARRA